MTQTEQPRFDLTREPWIPCETLEGKRIELGFREVLLRAHELAGIHDESPLATAVIHRLLLAILHRVFDGPADLGAWEMLWSQPAFDAGRVRSYLERWRHRFDLFDAKRPFFQVAQLADVMFKERDGKEAEAIPAGRLALERSYYAGAIRLLEHGGDDKGLTPAEAARAMLGFQGFGPGGRILNDSGYPKACPLRAGAAVLARGSTLRHTLLLNLLVPAPGLPPWSPDDAPSWEQDQPAQRTKRAVRGWLDALTWQARRVELLHEMRDGAVLVTSVITGVGVEPEGDWVEPMHAVIVRDAKRGPEAIRFDPDRTLWRDATALLQAAAPGSGDRRPAVCSQMAQLVERDVLARSAQFSLALYGLASSQAAIGLWRAERMPLPVGLLSDPVRLHVVQQGLQAAEQAASALRGSVWLLARYALAAGERSPDKKDIGALVDRLAAQAAYWFTMGALFDRFLQDVAGAEDTDAVLLSWKADAVKTVRNTLANAARQLGTSARAFQARAHAERSLHFSKELLELLPPSPPSPTQEGVPA